MWWQQRRQTCKWESQNVYDGYECGHWRNRAAEFTVLTVRATGIFTEEGAPPFGVEREMQNPMGRGKKTKMAYLWEAMGFLKLAQIYLSSAPFFFPSMSPGSGAGGGVELRSPSIRVPLHFTWPLRHICRKPRAPLNEVWKPLSQTKQQMFPSALR